MKASDVVQQLAAVLPTHTDKFTDSITITALSQSGGTATATAVGHGLVAGKQVNITGAKAPIVISTLTRVGTIGTLVTATPHDFTEGYSTEAELTGATEAEFNGTFTILTVPSRYQVTFAMADTGATVATGSPLLLNGANYLTQYNGLREVLTVPTDDTFTFAVPTATGSPAYGTIEARANPRITSVITEDQITQAYTRQDAPSKLWAFVVLGDVTASKSRQTETDATANIQRTEFYRQQLIQPLTIYVVIPSASEEAGRAARDLCEELVQPITKSVLFRRFPTYLTVSSKGALQFTGHGFAAYNRAYYVHAYEFEQLADLSFGDTVGYDADVAFRDLLLRLTPQQGNQVEVMTATINLDG
jgi:hypothetical protein